MNFRELKTVDDVIDELGGTSATAKLTGRKSQHVSNWRREKRLAKNTIVILQAHLHSRQLYAAPELWGIDSVAAPRRRKARRKSN
jgi:hypothetical protein